MIIKFPIHVAIYFYLHMIDYKKFFTISNEKFPTSPNVPCIPRSSLFPICFPIPLRVIFTTAAQWTTPQGWLLKFVNTLLASFSMTRAAGSASLLPSLASIVVFNFASGSQPIAWLGPTSNHGTIFLGHAPWNWMLSRRHHAWASTIFFGAITFLNSTKFSVAFIRTVFPLTLSNNVMWVGWGGVEWVSKKLTF
jgi:hypothetical protein